MTSSLPATETCDISDFMYSNAWLLRIASALSTTTSYRKYMVKDTDGAGAPCQCSLCAAARPRILLTCAVLMTSHRIPRRGMGRTGTTWSEHSTTRHQRRSTGPSKATCIFSHQTTATTCRRDGTLSTLPATRQSGALNTGTIRRAAQATKQECCQTTSTTCGSAPGMAAWLLHCTVQTRST